MFQTEALNSFDFSPHTRGCSWSACGFSDRTALFPAHAGVIPMTSDAFKAAMPFPRTRGGDPGYGGFDFQIERFSPHTRG